MIIPGAKSVNDLAIVKAETVKEAATVNKKAEDVINKFLLDAEVFDIGQKEVVLELSWLK